MKKTTFISLFILVMASFAVAGEPMFASINWDDGNDTVIAKIGKIQGFAGVLPTHKGASEPFWICNPNMETAEALDIKPTALNRKRETLDSNIDTHILNPGDVKHQINSIDFSRSRITDKLLMIKISFNKDKDTFTRELGDTIDLLLKKHGLPLKIIRDTYQWKISNVEIDADGSSGIISYSHLVNINEHCKLGSQK